MTDAPTLADVARAAGVSLATASRALHGAAGRRVGDDLRARVLRAAAALDYTPNAQAQAIARGTSTTVGLLVHDIADPYFSAIASEVIRGAEAAGLVVAISATGPHHAAELEHLRLLRRWRARGVILAGSRSTDAATRSTLRTEILAASATGIGIACIGQGLAGVNAVVIGNRAAARDLAQDLHALGYRDLAILAGPPGLATAIDRTEGFRAAFAARGTAIPEHRIIPSEFTRDGGYHAMTQLLDRAGAPPRCVFAANDVMAVGAMAAVRDRGLRVPHDIAIAGFDDIATLRDIVPALTTVRIPLHDIGSSALRLALSAPTAGRRHHITGTVVIRETTPPLAALPS